MPSPLNKLSLKKPLSTLFSLSTYLSHQHIALTPSTRSAARFTIARSISVA